jgi:hypothetical protein
LRRRERKERKIKKKSSLMANRTTTRDMRRTKKRGDGSAFNSMAEGYF